MSITMRTVGDFSDWNRVTTKTGEAMAWNWPEGVDVFDVPRFALFPAIAIGTWSDNSFIIRTPMGVPNSVVLPVQALVGTVQARKHPIAVSLGLDLDEDGNPAGEQHIILHAPDERTLGLWMKRLNRMMDMQSELVVPGLPDGMG